MKLGVVDILKKLYLSWSGSIEASLNQISGSGSNRNYYRISDHESTAIGVYGKEFLENKAFLELTSHFKKYELNVPEIYTSDLEKGIYIQQDLGDDSLFDLVQNNKSSGKLSEKIVNLYKQSLEELIRFQVVAACNLDYSVCYPRGSFDRQSMQWDLNYFKYYFLKLQGEIFNEEKLENDFQALISYLEQVDSEFFMYRDFQSRNILIFKDKPFFIDYQGGRKGPLQYDLASLLFQAKADLPPEFRLEMLMYYLEKLTEHIVIDKEQFIKYYYGFVLIRTMQVLGAYGYRGYYERKSHFLESVNFALKNLEWLINNVTFEFHIPELMNCFTSMFAKTHTKTLKKAGSSLALEINSFSFLKMEVPKDTSGHGGGFVFDCRSLPNPGRYAEYKKLTGQDKPVIDFLKKEPEMDDFLQNVFRIIDQAVDNYIDRGFDHLMVSFGCTGGQHRSVYCAEKLHKHLEKKFNIKLTLDHKMMGKYDL